MKRFRKLGIISLVLVICCGGFYFWRKSKNSAKYASFTEYYSANYSKKDTGVSALVGAKLHRYEYLSGSFKIDTIFRSMMGPLSAQPVRLNEGVSRVWNFIKGPKLCWLIGYSVDVVEATSGIKVSDDFLCHNNLDIRDKSSVPWHVNTTGTFARVFTLTEGQTSVMLPDGYGIPMLNTEAMVINSQVLNHNYPDTNITVRQKVTIFYLEEDELKAAMKPVYQQAVFVTKQVSGPAGAYGDPIPGIAMVDSSEAFTGGVAVAPHEDTCCSGRSFTKDYNPYYDLMGRQFTGHWRFGTGEEVLQTDVTTMMDLPYDAKVYFIGVHAHPFSRFLELRDKTANESLFKANNENLDGRIGLKRLDNYSNEKGIQMYKGHKYELVSTYFNPTRDVHTAMATMFLYLDLK